MNKLIFVLPLLALTILNCCQTPSVPEVIQRERAYPQLLVADSLISAGLFEDGKSIYADLLESMQVDTLRNEYFDLELRLAKVLYYADGQEEEARLILRRAIEAREQQIHAQPDTILGKAFLLYANVLAYLKAYEEAEEITDRSLAIFDPEQPDHLLHVITAYTRKGMNQFRSKNFDLAIHYFHKSLALQPEVPIGPFITTCTFLAEIYMIEQQNFYQAEKIYQLGLEACIAGPHKNLLTAADFALNLSNNYCRFGQWEKASEQVINARKYLAQTEESHPRYLEVLGISYHQMGWIQELAQKHDSAIVYYQQSLDLLHDAPDRHYQSEQKICTMNDNIGTVYYNLGRNQEALKYYKEGLKWAYKTETPLWIANSHNNVATVHIRTGTFDKAFQNLGKSLAYGFAGFQGNDFGKLPELDSAQLEEVFVLPYIGTTAQTFFARYTETGDTNDLDLSYQYGLLAQQLIDRHLEKTLHEESQINFLESAQVYFPIVIKPLLHFYRLKKQEIFLEEALEYAEKSKAYALLNAVQQDRTRTVPGQTFDQANYLAQKGLKNKILRLEKEIYREKNQPVPDQTKVQKLNMELVMKNLEMERLNTMLKDQLEVWGISAKGPSWANAREIQSMIGEDQTLLSYLYDGEDGSKYYVFVINSDSIDFQILDLDEHFKEQVLQFNRSLHAFNHETQQNCEDFRVNARTLHRQLILPFADQLKERVIVVPDQEIALIPFACLLTDEGTDPDCRELSEFPFLIRKHAFSYCHSASLLRVLQSSADEKVIPEQILAIAPSFNQNADYEAALEVVSRYGAADKLPPLYFNEKEVEQIGQVLEAKTLYGSKATKLRFQKLAPNYKILHMATHGVVNDENPKYSYLSFSQSGDSIELEELLFVNELYSMRLNAEMVILSACETAVGEGYRGEGVISLARGFLYAGAKSVIPTLWKINDQRSTELMALFYRYLKKGMPKDIAMQTAQLNFINSTATKANPAFWGTYIPIGNMEPLQFKKKSWFW